jgi:hypothetical protein
MLPYMKRERSVNENPLFLNHARKRGTDRELDAGQFPAVLGRRDLALVHRHAHTEEPDSESTDDAAKDHDPETRRKGLEEAAEGKDARAGKDGGAAAKDVADAAGEEGSDCRFRLSARRTGQ